MIETKFECRVTVQDQDSGYFKYRNIEEHDLYTFTMEFANAMFQMTGEATAHAKAIEVDKMEEQGELPF